MNSIWDLLTVALLSHLGQNEEHIGQFGQPFQVLDLSHQSSPYAPLPMETKVKKERKRVK
jgi:hypothetical protein